MNGSVFATVPAADKRMALIRKKGFVPKLSIQGEVRRTMLELCDQQRAMEEIARLVREKHPDVYGTQEVALDATIAILSADID